MLNGKYSVDFGVQLSHREGIHVSPSMSLSARRWACVTAIAGVGVKF
jgi:hypothetical protein